MNAQSHQIKSRDKLNKDIQAFIDAGGKIEKLPSIEPRSEKIRLVKRHLFHQAHHTFHAKKLEIPLADLKGYGKKPHTMSDETLERLWVYFRHRESLNLYK